jgi:hypothetical protein
MILTFFIINEALVLGRKRDFWQKKTCCLFFWFFKICEIVHRYNYAISSESGFCTYTHECRCACPLDANLDALLSTLSDHLPRMHPLALNVLSLTFLWFMWKSRNRMVFNGNQMTTTCTALWWWIIYISLWVVRAPRRVDLPLFGRGSTECLNFLSPPLPLKNP